MGVLKVDTNIGWQQSGRQRRESKFSSVMLDGLWATETEYTVDEIEKKKKEGTCNMSLMQSKIYITYNLFVLFLLWMREAVTSERPNVIRSSVAAAQRLWWVCTLMFQCITLLTKKESGEGDGGWESISLFCILFWHFCSYLSKFTNCTVSFYN